MRHIRRGVYQMRSFCASSKKYLAHKVWGPRTISIHGGESTDPLTNASVPPIHMSTTFGVTRPLAFSVYDQEQSADAETFVYTRLGNPTIRQLEQKVALLEGAASDACLCFASGMSACTALLIGRLSAGDHLVMSDIAYAGTAELVRTTLPRLGVRVTLVDTSDSAALRDALLPETRMLWIESPCNPIVRLTDLEVTVSLARAVCNKVEIVVDSTFATPVATQPIIDYKVDWVVHSLTKYIGGHGDALGGAVIGSNPCSVRELSLEAYVHYGGTMSPFNAWLIMRGLSTLHLRMQAHESNAVAVAEFLEGHAAVERVVYPGLASHPQHELAKRQMRNFSGMINFQVRGGLVGGEQLATIMMERLAVVKYAVSLGHHRSLCFFMPTDALMASSFSADTRSEKNYRSFAGDGMFRLSVGLEDSRDVIADVAECLSAVSSF